MKLYYWGTVFHKRYFGKWYDGYTGLSVFGADFMGLRINDNIVLTNPREDLRTKRQVLIYITILFAYIVINLFNITKSRYGGLYYLCHGNSKWYNGYSGLNIFDKKILGISISTSSIWFYMFGLLISIDWFDEK